jgi:hypothetical protein
VLLFAHLRDSAVELLGGGNSALTASTPLQAALLWQIFDAGSRRDRLAAVYVMAAEHPEVCGVLGRPFDNNVQPRDIVVPIAELLGPCGHKFCSGFTLNGWPELKAARKEWLQAERAGRDFSEIAEPEVERISTFEGGQYRDRFQAESCCQRLRDPYTLPASFRRMIEEIHMSYSGEYWLKHRDAPFATFLAVVQAHLHSEADPDNFAALKRRVQADRVGDTELQTFRAELSRLLTGERQDLPSDAISLAADGDNWENDDEFLVWLWQQLYPNETVPGCDE